MKYRLTNNKREIGGTTLYQIEALKDFGNVRKGDRGGWIEKEENLSQDGDCWVAGAVEIMFDGCSKKKEKEILRHFKTNCQPLAYVSKKDFAWLLKKLLS